MNVIIIFKDFTCFICALDFLAELVLYFTIADVLISVILNYAL